MSDTLHSNNLNNKGTKTLLGREMIIRHRRECHGDQVKGHHDWNTLKCITACHFNNTVQYYFTEYIVDLKMMQQFLILEITNSELLIGTTVGSWTVKMPISFMCACVKFVHLSVLPILQHAKDLTTVVVRTFDVLPSQKPSFMQIESSLSYLTGPQS